MGKDPGGKFTLFDLMILIGAVYFAGLGWFYGRNWGWPIGLAGIVIGFLVGGFPGRIAIHLTMRHMISSLRAKSTEELIEDLNERYFLSHFIVPILLERELNAIEIQKQILNLLKSQDRDKRFFAWRTLNIWFSDTAMKLENFNQSNPSDYHQQVIEKLLMGDKSQKEY